MKNKDGITYKELEGAVRQVMNYYMGYRRNQKGMELALDRLDFLGTYVDGLKAADFHELMRVNESSDLIRMCQLATMASMERKESGRAYYRRTDYPDLNADFDKPLVIWKEDGKHMSSWGV
jgi:succinate dehydrogenase/fumarate reductase flavoprotein subunit